MIVHKEGFVFKLDFRPLAVTMLPEFVYSFRLARCTHRVSVPVHRPPRPSNVLTCHYPVLSSTNVHYRYLRTYIHRRATLSEYCRCRLKVYLFVSRRTTRPDFMLPSRSLQLVKVAIASLENIVCTYLPSAQHRPRATIIAPFSYAMSVCSHTLAPPALETTTSGNHNINFRPVTLASILIRSVTPRTHPAHPPSVCRSVPSVHHQAHHRLSLRPNERNLLLVWSVHYHAHVADHLRPATCSLLQRLHTYVH